MQINVFKKKLLIHKIYSNYSLEICNKVIPSSISFYKKVHPTMFPLISIDYTSKFESECGSARAIISLVVCVTQVICCASVLCKPLMRTNAPDDDWTTRESDRAKHICFDGRLFCAPRTPSSLSDYFKGFSQRGKRHVMVEFLISC